MLIEHRIEKGVCIIDIYGKILANNVEELKKYVHPYLTNESIQKLALNLAKVEYIDSSAIGLMASVLQALKRREADLILFNLNKKNRSIIKMISFDKIVTIYETEEEIFA